MPIFLKNTYSLILFVCLCFQLNAQIFYPKDSSYISTLSHNDKANFEKYKYQKIDTTLTNFQNYFPRNTNGSYGLPSSPLFFKYQTQNLGFNFYNAPYQNDMINKTNVLYHQTKGPYASLTGIAGSKQEQLFKFLFSNTFKNKLNISLGFNRYGSLGFYKRQQTFTNNFYVSSNYTSKTSRVGFYSFFLFNKVKHLENGGLKYDSVFKENVNINKQLLTLNLSGAKREVRYTAFNFNPWFRLNKKEDSSTVFSHFLNYEFEYKGNYSKYTDNGIATDNYYQVFYLDTIKTNDSSHWRSFTNGINYVLNINPIHSKLQIGMKNEYNQVHQHADSIMQNNSVQAGFYVNQDNYSGFVKVNYIVSGGNANDYLVEINNSFTKKRKINNKSISYKTYVNFSMEKRHADYIYNKWFSNNYEWRNNFVPTEKMQSTVGISSLDNRFGFGIISQQIKNQLYFSESIVPAQTSNTIQNLSAFIYKDFLLFKHLGFNVKYNYQSSSYQAITCLPSHILNSALYYQGNLFKNALQLQIGFNGTYFSEFNGMAYSPALNMYYVQTQKTVGNYPYVDFFLTARIKPVRFFVKIDHVTQGLFGSNYSLTPNYIQNDRAFKFGINWLFFD
jgi:hypothetical protein